MSEYTLKVSEVELGRYRLMAEVARAEEADAWAEAGFVPGARVADVGCGPAAMSVVLADIVGPDGHVTGVERDPEALAVAEQVVRESGASNIDLRQGEATATGIEPGSLDAVMMRHVLAHNGGAEQAIVNHLVSLVRPGGHVYLVDVDLTAIRIIDADPELDGLVEMYAEFHRRRGNDPMIGLRLAQLAQTAGLEQVVHRGRYVIIPAMPGLRPPPWAAKDAMVADGVATADDVARWGAAFERMDQQPGKATIFAPGFTVAGRKPG